MGVNQRVALYIIIVKVNKQLTADDMHTSCNDIHLQRWYNIAFAMDKKSDKSKKKKTPTTRVDVFFWQRDRDSNPNKQSQSLSCYRYTIPLGTSDIILSVFALVKRKIQKIFYFFTVL